MSAYNDVIEEQVKAGKIEPRVGQVYTTREIHESLALADAPCLCIVWNKRSHNVQISHMSTVMMNKWVDDIAGDRKWRYERTTSEWIPVFVYVDDRLPIDMVDAERHIDSSTDPMYQGLLWMTPVGFKRYQQ